MPPLELGKISSQLLGAFEGVDPAERDAIKAVLASFWREARAAYPDVRLDPALYGRFLKERVGAEGQAAALRKLQGVDLYLACACVQGSAPALRVFDVSLVPKLRRVVARIDRSPAFADEVIQQLRVSLFVSQGTRPTKIDRYQGRGAWGAWLAAVAVRVALTLRATPAGRESVGGDEALTEDPELSFLKRQHRAAFQRAFEAALAALGDREANVLRLHTVEGVSLDRIGTMYSAHRATAARWIASARRTLLRQTRARLAEDLKLPPDELDSLIELVRSRLDVSVARLLRARVEP